MTVRPVFDGGGLDELFAESVRAGLAAEIREQEVEPLVPAVIIAEFLVGHTRAPARAHRVLRLFQLMPLMPDHGKRAAMLRDSVMRQGGDDPGAIDAITAAFAEEHGVVVTRDRADFEALAAAGRGFDIYNVGELLAQIRRSGRAPRRRGRGTSR